MNTTKEYRLDMTMMFAIHGALRRELGHIARVAAKSSDDARHVMVTAAGWQMFKSYLHLHHACEDDMLWPVMEKSLAERPDDLALLAALEAEHAAIDPLIRAIDATLANLANPSSGSERLGDLADALSTTINTHLRHEEGEGLGLIDANVTEQQWQDFGQEHGKRNGPDAPRYLPWLLDGLDDAAAEHILERIPGPLRAAYRDEWLGAYHRSDRWAGPGGQPLA